MRLSNLIQGFRRYTSTSTSSNSLSHRLTSSSPLIRPLSWLDSNHDLKFDLERDFALYPNFYNLSECSALLGGSLWKLDRADVTRRRRRRGASEPIEELGSAQDLQKLFTGEYGFEEGHYDAVIHKYRETLLHSLPPPSPTYSNLAQLLNKAYTHLPTSPSISQGLDTTPKEALTHLLHLSPEGRIDGHVDNLDASGSMIIGICLGASRILRLETDGQGWDVLLENGSLYIQQGSVRYEYKHSILGYDHPDSNWNDQKLEPGHRISIMIRDAPTKANL